MEFTRGDGDNVGYGGGGALNGFMAGSMLNRDDRDKSMTLVVLAVIFFVIIFLVAIIFLAFAFRNDKREIPADYYSKKDNNIAELLAGIAAAKSMDNGHKSGEIDKFEIMQKIEHSDDRRQIENTQRDIAAQGQSFMQLGFGLSNQIKDNEKDNLREFGEIKGQLGMLSQGVNTLLIERNNSAIIQGVVNQLMCGKPCIA